MTMQFGIDSIALTGRHPEIQNLQISQDGDETVFSCHLGHPGHGMVMASARINNRELVRLTEHRADAVKILQAKVEEVGLFLAAQIREQLEFRARLGELQVRDVTLQLESARNLVKRLEAELGRREGAVNSSGKFLG